MMVDLYLEQLYDRTPRQFINRFSEVLNQIQDLDSRQVAKFFIWGLINGSLIHKIFIETPLLDMNEPNQGLKESSVVENRQRMAKNVTIAMAQTILQEGLRGIKKQKTWLMVSSRGL